MYSRASREIFDIEFMQLVLNAVFDIQPEVVLPG